MTGLDSPEHVVEIDGLEAPVLIRRARYAVPSVEADTLADAMCGLGYLAGCDRTFQLDLLRRRAAGRCAEILGPDALEEDMRQRALGLSEIADQTRADDLAVAYAAGVAKAFADSPCPVEHQLLGASVIEPWTPRDCLLVALLMCHMLSDNGQHRRMREVMRRCIPDELATFLTSGDPYAVTATGQPAPAQADVPEAAIRRVLAEAGAVPRRQIIDASPTPWGSNAMAVGPERTRDGRALLACDMHLPLVAPALCYRACLSWAGHHAAGFFIPGLPALVAGSTEQLAWGVTRLAADTVDLIEIEVDPADPSRYLSADGWVPFRRRHERIEVRGQAPHEFTVLETSFGPVDSEDSAGKKLASHWIIRDRDALDLRLADLLTAPDVARASDVLRAAGGPALNVLLADSAGHIGWTVTGRFPNRAPDAPAGVVRPALGERTWSDALHPAQLPELIDPPEGMIISANNGFAQHGTLAANHFGARRAYRIAELIRAQVATEATLYSIQLDQDAGFYEFYRQLALSAIEPASALGSAIAQWDGTARPSSRGLAALVLWRELLRESWFACLLAPCVGYDAEFAYSWHAHEAPLRALLSSDMAPLPYPDRRTFLRTELALCERLLSQISRDDEPTHVTWGELNPSGANHPLSDLAQDEELRIDLPADPPGGCPESVCATRPGFGPAMRLVVSPGRLVDGLANLPGGQSGDPRSQHYMDQFGPWLAGTPTPLADSEYDRGLRLVPPPGDTRSTGEAR